MANNQTIKKQANKIIARHTAIASATGAIPVPGASVAIVAENAAMVAELSCLHEHEVGITEVLALTTSVGGVNIFGRTVFVEGAKMLGWAAGPFGLAAVSALGATTAGLQTFTLGQLAQAMLTSGGAPLSKSEVHSVAKQAKQDFHATTWN